MRNYTQRRARLRDRARAIAAKLRPEAARIDAADLFPPGLLDLLWEAGFMTLAAPRERGGGGATLSETAVVVEELARGSGAAGLMVLLQALGVIALKEFADEKKGRDWFGRIVDGRALLSFALSEPAADPAGKGGVTRAVKRGSDYAIRGRKTFVSGAREADLILVFAVTGPRSGLKKALSAFVVPTGTMGMLAGSELMRPGLRGVPAVDLRFEGCRVPARSLLGRAGQGYAIAQKAIIGTAPLAAALACGLLAEAVEGALRRARTRNFETSPPSEFHSVELAVAELAAGLDSSRALAWAAARALEEGIPEGERLAREAKCFCTDAAVAGIDRAAELFGVEETVRGSLWDRLARDARAARMVLGPNHIHRIEAARKLLAGK